MAKRRKDPDEAPRGFQAPDFDEKEIIRKEIISFRSSLAVLGWAAVAALVCFALWLAMPTPRTGWFLGLFVMAGLGYLLRFILPRLKVDTAHFGKKEWFGTGALFFFSWLAVFIFITNPPVYDGVAPDLGIHVTPGAQFPGESVNITVIAADNVRVDPDSLVFALRGPSGDVLVTEASLWLSPHPSIWSLTFTPTEPGLYTVESTVADQREGLIPSGPHTNTTRVSFRIGDAMTVRMSGMDAAGVGHLTTSGDRVEVELPAALDVHRARLDIEGGGVVPLVRDDARSDETIQIYFAEARFAGFQGGANNFTVHVVEHDSYFLANLYGIPEIVSPLVSNQTYTVDIRSDVLGDFVPDLPGERDHTVQPVPGPPAVVLVGVLLGLLGLVRRDRSRRSST